MPLKALPCLKIKIVINHLHRHYRVHTDHDYNNWYDYRHNQYLDIAKTTFYTYFVVASLAMCLKGVTMAQSRSRQITIIMNPEAYRPNILKTIMMMVMVMVMVIVMVMVMVIVMVK